MKTNILFYFYKVYIVYTEKSIHTNRFHFCTINKGKFEDQNNILVRFDESIHHIRKIENMMYEY